MANIEIYDLVKGIAKNIKIEGKFVRAIRVRQGINKGWYIQYERNGLYHSSDNFLCKKASELKKAIKDKSEKILNKLEDLGK